MIDSIMMHSLLQKLLSLSKCYWSQVSTCPLIKTYLSGLHWPPSPSLYSLLCLSSCYRACVALPCRPWPVTASVAGSWLWLSFSPSFVLLSSFLPLRSCRSWSTRSRPMDLWAFWSSATGAEKEPTIKHTWPRRLDSACAHAAKPSSSSSFSGSISVTISVLSTANLLKHC